ncbi:Cytochrome c [Rubripirellula lacrimiformis]|uniref:Cytochrome c n=1 Tax=Rubripirellula lacrimiformis TaxID=1930273 RepID=A0A517NKS6_9BACT|nr:family 16 glycoside hydrolase [Rubripirellula lacrimiformis]QDT07730.1 Cytochrome c [Rubripirellula lacrimiformis]
MFSRTFALWLAITATFALQLASANADVTDPDFLVQGEYVGDQTGMQVVAIGDGEFDLVIYEGGLPGAGAKTTPPRRIEGDSQIVADLAESMGLAKINRTSPTLGAAAPAGAIALFDGTADSIDQHWESGNRTDEGWLAEGSMTKRKFRDYKLHVEFRTPWMPKASGQQRGNSGVYHQGRYETQVLDSFGLEGKDNEAGGIYEISSPSTNACFPPLSWQTYDVDFTAARFDDAGKKTADARMTVRLNGIIVQNDVAVPRATRAAKFPEGPQPGPIVLQNHGDPVRYRNLWIIPRDAEKEARRPIVPGFERFFAASPQPSTDGGELLISSLACNACHAGLQSPALPQQQGPDLSHVASRVRADALVAMIANPHATKPGTTMPDPWPGMDDKDRQARAAAIASYLIDSQNETLIERATTESMAQRGDHLYHSVGCAACHPSFNGSPTPPSTSVPLGDLASKYTLVSLARFLQNPHAVRPGHRMPALVGSPDEAFAIAAFLTGDVSIQPGSARFRRQIYRGNWKKLPDFSQLEPVTTDEVTELKIDDISPKNNYAVVFQAELPIASDGNYTFKLTSDDGSVLLIDGHRLDNDSIHPEKTAEATYELAAGVYPIEVQFFDGGGEAALRLEVNDPQFGTSDISQVISDADNVDFLPSKFVVDPALVDQGRQWFAGSGCKNCHALDDGPKSTLSAPALADMQIGRGCMSEVIPAGSMDYELNLSQLSAITAKIESLRHPASAGQTESAGQTASTERDAAANVHLTMATLNCYACHERGKLGGPELSRDAIFQTTTPEMGLEGRLPPALDGVGDKLNDEYFAKVVGEGANLRDYMLTRMPAFGYEPLRSFHQDVNAIDRRDDMQPAEHTDSPAKVLAAGRRAVGNKGLACIKCHSFGSEKGGGIGAIDMLQMTNRLRVEWFHRYLQDPTGYRPGTRMPNSFVDGKSSLADLYHGDPTLQIDAMWQYLGQGEKAKEPVGLKQSAIILAAGSKPLIYRNFFVGLSGRGIAVAYPDHMNLIWDAESMTMARIWRHSFIDASKHWVGRGQGNQEPLGDSIVQWESATPLAIIDSIDADWPSQPGRQRGYRFSGYRLDSSGNPTFQYSIGDVTVTDTPIPRPTPDDSGFDRHVTIDRSSSPSDATMVWQAATGDITAIDGGFQIGNQSTISFDGASPELISTGDSQSLRIAIPPGSKTTFTETIRW